MYGVRGRKYKKNHQIDKSHILRRAVVSVARVLNLVEYSLAAQIVIGVLMMNEDSMIGGVRLNFSYSDIAEAIAQGDPDLGKINGWTIFCRYYFSHVPPFLYYNKGGRILNIAIHVMACEGIEICSKQPVIQSGQLFNPDSLMNVDS